MINTEWCTITIVGIVFNKSSILSLDVLHTGVESNKTELVTVNPFNDADYFEYLIETLQHYTEFYIPETLSKKVIIKEL